MAYTGLMSREAYFKNKRIAVIGLGNHGEMVEDVKYLIKAGAFVSVYDLKSEARIKNHLVFLRSIGLANYVCGSIPSEDLLDMDLIILSHEYDRKANFLRDIQVPIEYPETLFFKQAPPVTVIGVMGECGKSTVVSILSSIMEIACSPKNDQKSFVLDPDSNKGILSSLKKIKSGDIVIIRITDYISKELYNMRISPQVSIYASLPSKHSYDKSPFEILSYQTYNNFIIGSDEIIDNIRSYNIQPKAKMIRTRLTTIPKDWDFNGFTIVQNKEKLALILEIVSLFKIDFDDVEKVLNNWKWPKGRMEFIKKVKNIGFYNDSFSVNPKSTEFAIKNLSLNRNAILIFGGADLGNSYGDLYKIMPSYVHTLVLIPGSGTIKERLKIMDIKDIDIKSAPSIEEAVRLAMDSAKKGDVIIFSPGFGSVGIDGSRKERGEKFVKAVRAL